MQTPDISKLASNPAAVNHEHEVMPQLAEARLPEMAAIIRVITGKTSMHVGVGEVNGGSFADVKAERVTLDPINIGGKIEEARLVSAHEGTHLRITSHPYDIPRSKEAIETLYKTTGFGYAQNVVEDIAVNSYLRDNYDAQRDYVAHVFDDPNEESVSVTPEVMQLMTAAGMSELPRFAQFGTALTRMWAHGNSGGYGNADPGIDQAVRTVWPLVESMLERELPDKTMDGASTKQLGIQRWELITEAIWPYFEQFVGQDLAGLAEQLQARGMSDEEAKAQVGRTLSDIEDALNEALNPADQADNPATETHQQQRQANQKQAEAKVAEAAEAQRQAAITAKRLSQLDPVEALIDDIASIPRQLGRRLMKLLGRIESETVTYGMLSGQTIDMRAAMQYEANPLTVQLAIFGRFVEPETRDWRIGVLADCSDSTRGTMHNEIMRALAVLARTATFVEAGNNQENIIKFALGQFGSISSTQPRDAEYNGASLLRSFQQPNHIQTQRAIGELLTNSLGNTPMAEATELMTTELRRDSGNSGNIVLFLTDGDPNSTEQQQDAMRQLQRAAHRVISILVRIDPNITQADVTAIAKNLGFDSGLAIAASAGSGTESFVNKLAGTIEQLLA